MKSKGIFYMGRGDCGVCMQVDRAIVQHLDYDLEYVDLSENRDRIAEAESAGVKTLPALVLEGRVFHINFGAELSAIA
jgi:hypothetical protein